MRRTVSASNNSVLYSMKPASPSPSPRSRNPLFQVALGLQFFDQLLERHFLIVVGGERHLAHVRQELAEARLRVDAPAHDERVDEEAYEVFGLAALPVGDGRPDGDVVLIRVTVEQHHEGGEQRHEERAALAIAERLQSTRQLGGQRQRLPVAARVRLLRALMVGGQLQERYVSQLPAPVVELAGERFALHRLALPHGEVRELNLKLGERRDYAARESLVERGHLPNQHAH
jgi:hypothetical protein